MSDRLTSSPFRTTSGARLIDSSIAQVGSDVFGSVQWATLNRQYLRGR